MSASKMMKMRVSTKAKRVLLVDDDASLCKVFGEFLCTFGYQTGVSETGAGALRQVVGFQPHLVVLDIGLPDMSGLEVLRQIKTNPVTQNILVILVTGTASLEMKMEGFQTGASDFLSKPVNLRELLLKIDHCFATQKDEETAVALEQKELLNCVAHTLSQGLTSALAAIRNEVRLSHQEKPNQAWVDRMRRIEAFAQEAEKVLIQLRSM